MGCSGNWIRGGVKEKQGVIQASKEGVLVGEVGTQLAGVIMESSRSPV